MKEGDGMGMVREDKVMGDGKGYVVGIWGGYHRGVRMQRGGEYGWEVGRESGWGLLWGRYWEMELVLEGGGFPVGAGEVLLDLGYSSRVVDSRCPRERDVVKWIGDMCDYVLGGGRMKIMKDGGLDLGGYYSLGEMLWRFYRRNVGWEWGELFPWKVDAMMDELWRREKVRSLGVCMKRRMMNRRKKDFYSLLVGDENVISYWGDGVDMLCCNGLRLNGVLDLVKGKIERWKNVDRLELAVGYADVNWRFARRYEKLGEVGCRREIGMYMKKFFNEVEEMRREGKIGEVVIWDQMLPVNVMRSHGVGYREYDAKMESRIRVREIWESEMEKRVGKMDGWRYRKFGWEGFGYEEDGVLSRVAGDYIPYMKRGRENEVVEVKRGEMRLDRLDISGGLCLSSWYWRWDWRRIRKGRWGK